MTLAEQLIAELTQETAATRRVLERVPQDKLAWKPHAKSRSIGALAWHIAVLPLGITELVTPTVAQVPSVTDHQPQSVDEVLSMLDRSVAAAVKKISEWGDEGLAVPWRMVRGGKTIIELPRSAMLRTILLNHWYHHRGQLTVYLRELNVPLPGIYGPTADDAKMPIE